MEDSTLDGGKRVCCFIPPSVSAVTESLAATSGVLKPSTPAVVPTLSSPTPLSLISTPSIPSTPLFPDILPPVVVGAVAPPSSGPLTSSAYLPPVVSQSVDDDPLSSPSTSIVSSEEASPATVPCPVCAKSAATLSILWHHINVSHISRRVFPSLGIFQRHNRFICSDPSCRFGYLKRWSVCQRSLGSDRRCGAPLVDPSLILVAACDVPESPVVSSSSLPCSLSSVQSSPERMISVAVQAAIDHHLPAELTSNETLIFDTFISRLCLLHVHSIQHVPRMARPLLASCLSQEFSAVNQFGLWSFAWILMFAKLVLRSPPRAGRKKRYLVGSLVAERLSQWRSGAGIMSLWQDACAEATPPGDTVASEDVLARDNVRRALRWAFHGRYGNALQALGSKGVAPFTDVTAREELLRCHPQSSLPSHTSDVPPPLVV